MAKWTEETIEQLTKLAGAVGEIDYTSCEKIAEEMGTSTMSVTAKLRALGYAVGKKEKATVVSAYSDSDVAIMQKMADGETFIEDIVDALGKDSSDPAVIKSVRGKLLSMKLSAPTKNKKEGKPKTFTDAETEQLIKLAGEGKTMVEAAEIMGKTVQQISGKKLHLKLTMELGREKAETGKPKVYTDEVVEKIKAKLASGTALETIAEELGINPRGLKTQAVKLGLIEKAQKVVFWTDDKVAKLKSAFEGSTDRIDAIADQLGTSMPIVAKKLKELGYDYEGRKPLKAKAE